MGCGASACAGTGTGTRSAAAAAAVRRAQELARDVGALGAGDSLDMRAITSGLPSPPPPSSTSDSRAQ